MSHHQRRPHEGVMIDDIAEERAARARSLKEDFPGSRNVPSTGLNVPPPPETSDETKKQESQESKQPAKEDGKPQ